MTSKDFSGYFDIFLKIGFSGVPLFLVIYFLFFPDKAEKSSSLLFYLINKIFGWGEKKYIARDIQGRVNDFVKNTLSKKIKNIDPQKLKIVWTEEISDRQTFLKKGTLVLRMKKSDCQNENFVSAAMAFISGSLLTKTKVYISEKQKLSLDLFIANKLFESQKREIVLKFVEDFLHVGTKDPKILGYFNTYYVMDLAGVFFPVFIQEMNFLGEKVFGSGRDPKIYDEVNGMIDFLEKYSNRITGDDITKTYFSGKFCKFRISIVGKSENIHYLGSSPYQNYLKKASKEGDETIYIIGQPEKKQFIDSVCDEGFLESIGYDKFDCCEYKGNIKKNGENISVATYLIILRKKQIKHFLPKQ